MEQLQRCCMVMTAATTHSCETGGDADAPFSCIEGGESEARMTVRCLDWTNRYNKTKKTVVLGATTITPTRTVVKLLSTPTCYCWLAPITLVMTSCNYAKSGTRLRLGGLRCFVGRPVLVLRMPTKEEGSAGRRKLESFNPPRQN